jgi:hypothetical protein
LHVRVRVQADVRALVSFDVINESEIFARAHARLHDFGHTVQTGHERSRRAIFRE